MVCVGIYRVQEEAEDKPTQFINIDDLGNVLKLPEGKVNSPGEPTRSFLAN